MNYTNSVMQVFALRRSGSSLPACFLEFALSGLSSRFDSPILAGDCPHLDGLCERYSFDFGILIVIQLGLPFDFCGPRLYAIHLWRRLCTTAFKSYSKGFHVSLQ